MLRADGYRRGSRGGRGERWGAVEGTAHLIIANLRWSRDRHRIIAIRRHVGIRPGRWPSSEADGVGRVLPINIPTPATGGRLHGDLERLPRAVDVAEVLDVAHQIRRRSGDGESDRVALDSRAQ